MEDFKEIVNIIFNSKVAEIISIAICVILVFAYIFSKTSIGKKSIFKLTSLGNSTKSYVETIQENTENELKKQKEEYENELNLYKECFYMFRDEVFEVLELVPNKKIKEFVKEHKDTDLIQLVKKHENKAQ